MKLRNFIIVAVVISMALCLGALAFGESVITLDPGSRSRVIRTGESLDAIRANALQTMDMGLDVLSDTLKLTSYREDVVIYKWDESVEKYLGLWRNTQDWMETAMTEKKLDTTKQKEWRKLYETFLDNVLKDGEAVLNWKWREELYRKNLDFDIKDIPKELTELRNTVKEANGLLSEAQTIARKSGATGSDIDQALAKVDMAENLMEKVSRQLVMTQEFVKKERDKKKTSLDSEIVQARDRLKGTVGQNPDIMNRWTEKVAKWADNVDTYWEYYKKSWTTWEDTVKPVMAADLLKDYSYFKDIKYADLTKVTEQARRDLEAMKR